MIFKNNRTYDILIYVVTIVLPAFVAFFAAMVDTWGIPYGTQIVATISAFTGMLGSCLMIGKSRYRKQTESK